MSSELSFGMWMYSRGGTGALRMLMDKEGEYSLALSTTGTLQFGLGNTTPGWSWVDTGVSLPVGRWTHLLFTYSAVTPAARLYIDGVSVYNNTTAAGNIVDTLPANNTLWLGKYSVTQGLQGAMDEVALWNRAKGFIPPSPRV